MGAGFGEASDRRRSSRGLAAAPAAAARRPPPRRWRIFLNLEKDWVILTCADLRIVESPLGHKVQADADQARPEHVEPGRQSELRPDLWGFGLVRRPHPMV